MRLLPLEKSVPLLIITALLLNQFIPVILPTSRISRNGQAEGRESNHQCGCPKEKVLSHTCCCSAYRRNCCAIPSVDKASENNISGNGHTGESVSSSGPDSRSFTGTHAYVASCGMQEQFKAESYSKSYFIATCRTTAIPAHSTLIAQEARKTLDNLFLEPPDPPPEITPSPYTLLVHSTG